MSDTTSSSDQDAQKHWEPWIQDWQFSNHAVFRIPEYLKSLMRDWHQQSALLRNLKDPESFYFFRHKLTNETARLPDATPLILFSQSALLIDLFSDKYADAAFVKAFKETPEGKPGPLVVLRDKIQANPDAWVAFLDRLKAHEEINFDLLKKLKDEDPTDEKLPELFQNIFLVFCNTPHHGFLQQHLNEHQMAQENEEERQKAQANIGYFLQLQEAPQGTLPRPDWIRALRWDGSLSDCFAENSEQKDAYDIFDEFSDKSTQPKKAPDHSGDWSDFLPLLFEAVNGKSIHRDRGKQYVVAVPVYGWSSPNETGSSKQRHRAGALLGWLLNRFPITFDPQGDQSNVWHGIDKDEQSIPTDSPLYQHLSSLAFLAGHFASKYLDGETEWALERPWFTNDKAILVMKRNFYNSCGWVCTELSWRENAAYFTFDETNPVQACLVNLTRVARRASGPTTGQDLVAKLVPSELCVLPADESARKAYLTCLAEHARYFYSRCLLIEETRETAREVGELTGQSGFLHDFSKDFDTLDIRMDRFESFLNRQKEDLEIIAERLSALRCEGSAVAERDRTISELRTIWNRYGLPALDLKMITRYQMMRMTALNAKTLIAEPQYCYERIVAGTPGDLNRVVNLLVWIRSPEWVNPDRAREEGRDAAAWSRIFAFQERSVQLREPLGTLAAHLFEKLQIPLEKLMDYAPKPELVCQIKCEERTISPGDHEMFLWPIDGADPVRPHLYGFLPLFVESLRMAYSNAYLATLKRLRGIEELSEFKSPKPGVRHPYQESVMVKADFALDENSKRLSRYAVHIRFPTPRFEECQNGPVLVDAWRKDLQAMQELVSQWEVKISHQPAPESDVPQATLTLEYRPWKS